MAVYIGCVVLLVGLRLCLYCSRARVGRACPLSLSRLIACSCLFGRIRCCSCVCSRVLSALDCALGCNAILLYGSIVVLISVFGASAFLQLLARVRSCCLSCVGRWMRTFHTH